MNLHTAALILAAWPPAAVLLGVLVGRGIRLRDLRG